MCLCVIGERSRLGSLGSLTAVFALTRSTSTVWFPTSRGVVDVENPSAAGALLQLYSCTGCRACWPAAGHDRLQERLMLAAVRRPSGRSPSLMLNALMLNALMLAAAMAAPLPQGNRSAVPCTNSYGPGLHEISLELIGRRFLLAVPDGLPNGGGRRVPGVIDWHGFSESPWYQNKLVGLEEIIDKYKWLGALPLGTAPLPTETCCPFGSDPEECRAGSTLDPLNPCSFNAGNCCGVGSSRDIDDITFARAMIEWMELEMCLDPENVFSTGFSNGGMITNRVACQASHLFKGVAPVAGNIRLGGSFEQCAPTSPVSWISVCGTEDFACVNDFNETAVLWSRLNECETGPSPTYVSATTRCEAWSDCTGGTFVEKCWVDDLGHEWSGRPRPDGSSPIQAPSNIDATSYIWARWSTVVTV